MEDTDLDSLGKIMVTDGIFNIQYYNDGFEAKNNIVIKKGNFDIENGYQSKTFNEDKGWAKGFNLSKYATRCVIRVYDDDFTLNIADEAFYSNSNLTLINENYKIFSLDDGKHAEFHLLIGKNIHLQVLQ